MSLLLGCLLLFLPPASTPAPALKDWANGPVSIVMADAEKKAWKDLKTDPERENFIEHFWGLRNPVPESHENEYQVEFERRVAAANTLFGNDTATEGWRTERGRYYILLGPPQTRTEFKSQGQLRPIELWFYSGQKKYPQLPAFFYLMFYQRDEIGDYRQYSPYIDQPQSLVKATIRGNGDAYNILKNVSIELARASLSLIPGEPVDLTNFTPTMTSDAVLSQIHQIPRRDFERIGLQQELVQVHLKYDLGTVAIGAFPFISGPNAFTVDYTLERPAALGDAHVETTLWRDGRQVGQSSATIPKEQPLAGRLILSPGDYVVEATVTDPQTRQSWTGRQALQLRKPDNLSLSDLMFYRSATAAPNQVTIPFVHSGYRFTADAERQLTPVDKLQVLFQIAAPDAAERAAADQVSIDYTIAGISDPGRRLKFHDDIAMNRFDANGLLLNSKTMPLKDLPAGKYYLIVLVTDRSGHRASQTVSFDIRDFSD